MTYRLPSLNGLRAFEAAARHLSFKHAAAELCVTPGAISQQVKTLETAMGTTLFNRLPNGLTLTAEGETYFVPISHAFRSISRATDTISSTLPSRDFKLGIHADVAKHARRFFEDLKDNKTGGRVAVIVDDADLEDVRSGRIDALIRLPVLSFPGLHLDQVVVDVTGREEVQLTLILRPGTAGCREHELFLSALRFTHGADLP